MINLKEIGIIKSHFKKQDDPFKMREFESTIEIKEEFKDGLFKLEESEYIDVLFYFHKSEDYDLITTTYFGEKKGVFASRSPRRPSNIGVSRVKLLKIENNKLLVKGLDAVDSTPVIDIKPSSNKHDNIDEEKNRLNYLKNNPRNDIIPLIKNNKLEELLILSGTLHGHYCPGLAMGVISSVYAINEINIFSDGLEDIIAIIEINSCYADGIQYITGCTIGNNSLIFKDYGKTAFSLVKRNGEGLRLSVKSSYREKMAKQNLKFQEYFNKVVIEQNRDNKIVMEFKKSAREASFKLLEWDINDIFDIKKIKTDIPDYAPIRESVICSECGESVMKAKEINTQGKVYCKECSHNDFYQLDGTGISLIKK